MAQIKGDGQGGATGWWVDPGYGVWGDAASSVGVAGTSSKTGVYGGSPLTGVLGAAGKGSGIGVLGQSYGLAGVYGQVYGAGRGKAAVIGWSERADGVAGYGYGAEGYAGVSGQSNDGDGVHGSSARGDGVAGTSQQGAGVSGYGVNGPGVVGIGENDSAIAGFVSIADTPAATFSNWDLVGSGKIFAVVLGPALECFGHVAVEGNLTVSGAKQFRIDHPLDPDRQYLSHAAVEAPEMKNFYDGIATIGRDGEAIVKLPKWFGALNRDFRYQLTAIGASCSTLFVAKEIRENRFTIGGGRRGLKVSWQITGIRDDAWARAYPMRVESPKPKHQRGRSPALPLQRRERRRALSPALMRLVAMQEKARQRATTRQEAAAEGREQARSALRPTASKGPRKGGRRRDA